MIFHDLKAIFIHVERTGGVALRKLLQGHETNFERIADTKHLTSEQTYYLTEKVWSRYFKFSIVRNPFARLVSWYFACKQNPLWKSSLALHIQKASSFENMILNPHPKLLINQVEKVAGIDFVGRYEEYAQAVQIICTKLNIPYRNYIDNTSQHEDYKKYYSDETRKIVTNWYKEDLQIFNYKF